MDHDARSSHHGEGVPAGAAGSAAGSAGAGVGGPGGPEGMRGLPVHGGPPGMGNYFLIEPFFRCSKFYFLYYYTASINICCYFQLSIFQG